MGIWRSPKSFVELHHHPKPIHITIADGSYMTSTQGGIVHIHFQHEGKLNLVVLENQLLVPEASGDLISLARMTQFLYRATIHITSPT